MTVFPERPLENQDPWYSKREVYDKALENSINDRVRMDLGSVPDGTDLFDFFSRDMQGARRLPPPGTADIKNAPPELTSSSVIEYWASDYFDTATLRITTGDEIWWTRSTGQSSWMNPWQRISPDVSKLRGLAIRDGWKALYDPTDESTVVKTFGGRVIAIRDSLGNLPPMKADASSATLYPEYMRNEFGMMSAYGEGTLTTGMFSEIPQPYTIMAVTEDEKYLDAQRCFIGSDSASSTRAQMGITASEEAYIGNSNLIRSSTPILPGVHIWEGLWSDTQTRINVDGQLSHRGLPEGNAEGLTSLRSGANRRTSSTSTTFPWKGKVGAIVVGSDISSNRAKRMRKALQTMVSSTTSTPNFARNIRAINMDSKGRPTVIWGDPDLVTTGSVASCTKVLNAIVARKTFTNSRLNEIVEVSSEDEFIPNTPNLVAGDKVSVRDLFYSMLVPSNNTAPRTLARLAGSGGSGNPVDNFVSEMQAELNRLAYYGASILSNPGGGLRISTRDLANLMLEAVKDPFLLQVMGTATHDVTITGPNPRVVSVENTFITSNDYGRMEEWIASKDGTGTSTVASVFLWQHDDGSTHVGAIQGGVLGQDRRYFEVAKLIEAARSGDPVDYRHIPSSGFKYNGGPIAESWGFN